MKRIKLSLACFSISLLLFSCGSKDAANNDSTAATQDPKSYYDNVELHVGNFLDSYSNFSDALSAEDKTGLDASYDTMIKSFDAEKKSLAEIETLKGDDDKTISQNLKDAAIVYVDVYIEGGKKELLEIKKLVADGNSSFSTEVLDVKIPFSEKSDAAKSTYIKLKKEFRKKYDIKNH